jgi:formate hydrogenlyase subunit 6/NADH:ubiquinone oxidoreductase subunit I
MAENAALFTSTPPGAVEQKDRLRQAMEARVNSQNQNYTFKASLTNIHRQTLENVAAWRQITKDCVDCQACNRVCPSCTCFLLVDQFHHGEEEKIKVWDNCLHGSYTRVAGGTNDRGALFSRLQNRYHCKFDYMVSRTGNAACVGCGRCIDACLGKIDMRTVFKTLEKAAVLSAKLI